VLRSREVDYEIWSLLNLERATQQTGKTAPPEDEAAKDAEAA
jgi:hypothetical protein